MFERRIVILGAAGFVGQALCRRLAMCAILPLARVNLDLLHPQASDQLQMLLRPDDILVIAAAEAPCKNNTMLYHNIGMMHAICVALQKQPVHHVIYISSDAVYADSDSPLTENSITAPDSLHGIMHLAREKMLQDVCTSQKMPLAILRPSLLYGIKDPHNGYGPNRFLRLSYAHKTIELFGAGEEQRDHVYIDDVAEIIARMIQCAGCGILNIATGRVISFKTIAEEAIRLSGSTAGILSRARQGSMPHNGYRSFDIRLCQQMFPDFSYTTLENGLYRMYTQISVCQEA